MMKMLLFPSEEGLAMNDFDLSLDAGAGRVLRR